MRIIKNKKISYSLSLVIIAIGLIMFVINGLNYGIDFTGGTMLQLSIGEFVSVEKAREIVDPFDTNASVIHTGTAMDEIIIRSSKDLSNTETSEIVQGFVKEFGMSPTSFQTQKFGPFMGEEIRNKAITSVLIASALMLAYISYRFQFKYGVAAIVALVHDVLITLSFYAIFRLPVNSSFIAAILTIVGYSINDTIVIFDRIREEIRLNPKMTYEQIIDSSVKLSMRRTVFTTLTTLIAVVSLYFIGVEDVKVLALPLLVGMIAGTYSSIYIASPIVFQLKKGKA